MGASTLYANLKLKPLSYLRFYLNNNIEYIFLSYYIGLQKLIEIRADQGLKALARNCFTGFMKQAHTLALE